MQLQNNQLFEISGFETLIGHDCMVQEIRFRVESSLLYLTN